MINWAALSLREHDKVRAALFTLSDDLREQALHDLAAGKSNRLMDACTHIAGEINRAIEDLEQRERIYQALMQHHDTKAQDA